LNQNRLL